MKKISYSKSGVNYHQLDMAKRLALSEAKRTAIHLKENGMSEISDSRGESAFAWQQNNVFMATVTESLGTKNLVADAMRKVTGKSYYDVIGNDTVAAIVNDITALGAKPLVVTALWAVGASSWFNDKNRIKDLISGWKKACDLAKADWGGGESPSYFEVVNENTIALAGSAVGIITSKNRLMLGKNLKVGDRIIFLNSSGINANGISLARAIAKKVPGGYAAKLESGKMFGEAILTPTNIYSNVIQKLLDESINVHYISNITGHGLRKVMRATIDFTYVIEKLFEAPEVFTFIKKHAGVDDYEMYQTYNMGQDYAIFVSTKDVNKTLAVIKKCGFEAIIAGYVEKGPRQVIIKPKDMIFTGETLDLR